MAEKELDLSAFDPVTKLPLRRYDKWPTADELREIAKTEENPIETLRKLRERLPLVNPRSRFRPKRRIKSVTIGDSG